MNTREAKEILAEVRYQGYSFQVHGDFDAGPATYLQAFFTAPDNDDQRFVLATHTRKWLLSRYMTRSELVQTAFKCVLTSIEHEAREQFTYRGQRVFGPHFDVDALVSLAGAGAAALDIRKEPA